jgi:hypothetical protein
LTGTSGYSGVVGSSGYSGVGTSGATGISGANGDSGYSGISGYSSESGFSGYSGISGMEGLSGYSAISPGPQGDSGFSGATGATGTWTGVDTISYVLDGGEYPISNGTKGTLWFSYPFTITDWKMLAEEDGNIEVDIWSSNYATFPATILDSIVGAGTAPHIASSGTIAKKAQAVNLSGWTTSFPADTAFTIYVKECSAITRATIILKILRT